MVVRRARERRTVLAAAPEAPVLAICADGQAPTLVATDATGRQTRPAITWMDVRSVEERRILAETTGLGGWGLANLAPALWVERHDPRAARPDGLVPRDLGVAESSPDGSRSIYPSAGAGDARSRSAAFGRTAPRAPGAAHPRRCRRRGAASRHRRSISACRWAFPSSGESTTVTRASSALGCASRATRSTRGGTSGGFGVVVDREVDVPGALIGRTPMPDRWVVGGAMAATGKALEWFRDDVLGGERTTDVLVAEAAATPPGADGLVFLPYLAGERSPIWDPEARGAFAGLDARPRPGPPRAGDPRGRRARHSARRRADPRGRHRGRRDARLRRDGAQP